MKVPTTGKAAELYEGYVRLARDDGNPCAAVLGLLILCAADQEAEAQRQLAAFGEFVLYMQKLGAALKTFAESIGI